MNIKKILKTAVALLMAGIMILSLFGCNSSGNNNDNSTGEEEKEEPVAMIDPINDNYRTFYQIFVGSFSDSNGDGIGDLRGIINRFDYLNDGDINSGKSLGVQGIWLSPIFSSPSYHKYDAKDYYTIDWRFGTEDDLKELIQICNERNVKLILDLAINHTSNKHDWFLKFKEARINGDVENKYYDYYSCATTDEKASGVIYQKIAGVDCWYECNFSSDMPELNFDNHEVREETLKIAKYYLDLGVHGFRFDAIKYIYYGDTAKSVDFLKWYTDELRKINPDIYCVGECWSGETDIVDYYSSMNCFNFAMSQAEGIAASAAKGISISKYLNYIVAFNDKIAEKNPGSMAMSFLSNHDMDRIAGAFVTENYMRMAANLYLLSPGSPFIYYGEEIGMRGSRGAESTDANRRLAMLWGDDDSIRNPIGSTYPDDKQIKTTVADQINDENSLYNYYCKLIAIRHKYPAIARGEYKVVNCGEKNLGGFLIEYQNEKIVLLHNNSSEEISIDVSTINGIDTGSLSTICDYIGVGSASFEGTVITVGPQTSVIIK
jgi:glycosidase